MRRSKRLVKFVYVVLFVLGIFTLTGCGSADDAGEQADPAVRQETPEEPSESSTQEAAPDTAQIQDTVQEQGAKEGPVIRAYSDEEKERMAQLLQSYQRGDILPEKRILEVDSPEAVADGTLCYIISTGEYYLPDRELTDEDLLEIIDCNVRIAVNAQGWTQEKIDEANRRDRAEREAKIKAADGLSEEEAIEIARKTMEADLGEKAKKMEVGRPEDGKLYLWEDDGVISYCIQFGNTEEVVGPEDVSVYQCVVNAIDGSICSACTLRENGDDIEVVEFEH